MLLTWWVYVKLHMLLPRPGRFVKEIVNTKIKMYNLILKDLYVFEVLVHFLLRVYFVAH